MNNQLVGKYYVINPLKTSELLSECEYKISEFKYKKSGYSATETL